MIIPSHAGQPPSRRPRWNTPPCTASSGWGWHDRPGLQPVGCRIHCCPSPCDRAVYTSPAGIVRLSCRISRPTPARKKPSLAGPPWALLHTTARPTPDPAARTTCSAYGRAKGSHLFGGLTCFPSTRYRL